MSSLHTYQISKDFNDKAAEHSKKSAIPGYTANVVKKNENRNMATIEPIKNESFISYRLPVAKPTKESMKARKLSYFSSIVE